MTVNNRPGVLNRITGLFTKRHYNIESITVGHTEIEGVSRMTFVVNVEDERTAEQITKQLNKQIDVLKVNDITDQAIVARELALIKVSAAPAVRQEIYTLIEPFRASIVDVSRDSLVVQVTGEPEKVDALLDLLTVSYTHLLAHATLMNLVCRLLLEKKNQRDQKTEEPI